MRVRAACRTNPRRPTHPVRVRDRSQREPLRALQGARRRCGRDRCTYPLHGPSERLAPDFKPSSKGRSPRWNASDTLTWRSAARLAADTAELASYWPGSWARISRHWQYVLDSAALQGTVNMPNRCVAMRSGQDQLVGTWLLVGVTAERADGSKGDEPFGANPNWWGPRTPVRQPGSCCPRPPPAGEDGYRSRRGGLSPV